MTVVQYEQMAPLPASEPGEELEPGPVGWVARLRGAAEYAAYIADTEFVPDPLRGKPAAIAAAILYGAEVGLEPMQSLAKIAVIKGRPSLYAEAQRGLIVAAGHELWFDETTATRAIAAGRRAGTNRVGRITWTLDDARRAGLVGGENWRKYPAAMLRARASADLARAMFADVLGGMPAVEELQDEPENGPSPEALPAPPADVEPPTPATRTRKRATSKRTQTRPPVTGQTDQTRPRPPVEPTPPPDRQEPPPASDPPATEARKRQIFALMRDVGLDTRDRDERLAYVRRVIARPDLPSSNDLTQGEAMRVVDDLSEIKALPPEQRPTRLTAHAPTPEEATSAPQPPPEPEPPPDDDIPF